MWEVSDRCSGPGNGERTRVSITKGRRRADLRMPISETYLKRTLVYQDASQNAN
jgi:hypothetical protein